MLITTIHAVGILDTAVVKASTDFFPAIQKMLVITILDVTIFGLQGFVTLAGLF
jgi:hypothetical protein